MTSRAGLWMTAGIGVLLAFIAILAFTSPNVIPVNLPSGNQIVFGKGHAQGERIKMHAWSADYDRVTANQDQTVLDLQGVHHGIIYKDGKPYLHVEAEHLTVNTLSKDFSAVGKLHVERIGSARFKSFDTDAGSWINAQQRIVFPRPTVITLQDGSTIHVAKAGLNLKSGHVHLEGVSAQT